jgi:hypothetical protein
MVSRGRTAGRLALLWRRHRRLEPLRRLLRPALATSEVAGPRPPDGWWPPRSPRSRWTTAWAECRDGLVALSGYVPAGQPAGASFAEQADQLRTALAAFLASETPGKPRLLFAVPDGDGYDADLGSLVALADAVDHVDARDGGAP